MNGKGDSDWSRLSLIPQESRYSSVGGMDWHRQPRVLVRFEDGPFELLWIFGHTGVINSASGPRTVYSPTTLVIADTREHGQHWIRVHEGGRLSAALLRAERVIEFFGAAAAQTAGGAYRDRTVVIAGSGDLAKKVRKPVEFPAAASDVARPFRPIGGGEHVVQPGNCDVHGALERKTRPVRGRDGGGATLCEDERARFEALLATMPLWRKGDLPVLVQMYVRERRRELRGEDARLEGS